MRAAAVIVVGALAVACGGESAVGGEPRPATGGAASAPVQSSGSGGSEAPATGGTTSGAGGLETAGGASGAETGGTPQGGGEAGEGGRFLVGGQAGDSGSAGEDPAGAAGVVEAGGDGGAAGSPVAVVTGGADTGGTGGSGGALVTGGTAGTAEAGAVGEAGSAGAVVCECDEGPCCDGCHFLPSDTLCFEVTYDVCLPRDRYCREYEVSIVHLIPSFITIHAATHCTGSHPSCSGTLDVWEETQVCCQTDSNDCWQYGDPGAMNWWEFDEELIPTVECHMPPTYGRAGAGGATS